MRRQGRRASIVLETAMWIPILVGLLFGMVELARLSYTYYTLHKILYTIASVLANGQAVNFCDSEDQAITDAKNLGINGGIEGDTVSTQPIIQGLTADQINIRIERFNRESGQLEECQCSDTGCDASVGGGAPDFLVVSLPDGFPIRLTFPGLTLDPIPLRPQIRIPYGGT